MTWTERALDSVLPRWEHAMQGAAVANMRVDQADLRSVREAAFLQGRTERWERVVCWLWSRERRWTPATDPALIELARALSVPPAVHPTADAIATTCGRQGESAADVLDRLARSPGVPRAVLRGTLPAAPYNVAAALPESGE